MHENTINVQTPIGELTGINTLTGRWPDGQWTVSPATQIEVKVLQKLKLMSIIIASITYAPTYQ